MAPPRRKKAATPSPRRAARDGAEKRKAARAPKPRASADTVGGGDSLQAYIREISRFKPLSAEDEKILGHRIQKGDQEALQRLVESNLRFVVSYAKRYRGLGLSFLDLIHEGTLGLIEAAKRFDPERNVKFISYAVWWVRQAIFHALSEHMRVFRLPQKLSSQVSKMGSARQRLTAELERVPTTEELAAKTELSKKEVDAAVERLQALKACPRDQVEHRRLLLFAERTVGEIDPFRRGNLEEALDAYEMAMRGSDLELFRSCRNTLLIVLSEVGFPFEEAGEGGEGREARGDPSPEDGDSPR